ncbi:MAG: hypothetical protein ABS95_02190 [Verrucomicrobia bacterium SCN 57-15]|nr:MAG: hypothetical protein ABS95_02190 [Verrucomicrobia bacterium SCN 57-15]
MNSTRAPRILIVDDEPEIRALIAEILTQEGFEIREAGSAAEAIRILHAFTPNLLITDYSLPDANGSELIGSAKGIVPNLKCLMLTGWREFSGQLSNCSLADVVMSKPFSVDALEVETRRLLSAVSKERDSASSVAQEAR